MLLIDLMPLSTYNTSIKWKNVIIEKYVANNSCKWIHIVLQYYNVFKLNYNI